VLYREEYLGYIVPLVIIPSIYLTFSGFSCSGFPARYFLYPSRVQPVYCVRYRDAVTDWTSEVPRRRFDIFLKVIHPGHV